MACGPLFVRAGEPEAGLYVGFTADPSSVADTFLWS